MALQSSVDPQIAENGLLAKLTLNDAYSRFTADMFLSSLAESGASLTGNLEQFDSYQSVQQCFHCPWGWSGKPLLR